MRKVNKRVLVLTLLLVVSFYGQLAFAREKNDCSFGKEDKCNQSEAQVSSKETLKRSKLTNFSKLLAGHCYKLTYVRINRYLLDHIADDDAQKNLDKAIDWMHSNSGKGTILSKTLMAGLTQFTELNKIGDEHYRCNQDSYRILLKNNQATNSDRSAVSMRRIDAIVHKYSLYHAKECHNVYPISYQQKIQHMDKLLVERVESFTNDMINFKLNGKDISTRDFYDQFVATTCLLGGMSDAHVASISIRQLASEDPDLKYLKQVHEDKKGLVIRKDKIEQLFNKYLLEPCIYYIENLGLNVFLPASLDATFLLQVDKLQSDFYRAWARFRICNSVVDNYLALIKDLMKFAKKLCNDRN